MEELNAKSLADLRRQKKKRAKKQKIIAFMIFFAVIFGLYVSKDRWMPNFTIDNSGYTDDEITTGEFPLKIANGTNYKTCVMGDKLMVLTDTRRYLFSPSGETFKVESHAYSNPIMKSDGSRVLMYEQNGTSLRMDSKRGTLYEKKTDNPIYLASAGSRGYSAVVTQSDQYVCELHVFDISGDEIYFRGCTQRVMDVVFRNDCNGCYVIMLNVAEGNLVSEVMSINFENSEEEWKIGNIVTCPVSVHVSEDDKLILFGDDMYVCFDTGGNTVLEYKYPGALIDASYSDAGAVMIFENKERRSATLSVITEPETGGVTEARVNEKFRHVLAWEDRIYLLAETSLESYGYDGKAVKKLDLEQPFRDFRKAGKYIFLEGHRSIEKKEF